ncbi:MAG: AAA family ATPase [Solirubrobacterales bacterium]
MRAVVITGPPGAGKSEVAASLHDLLGEAGVDAALVECDEVERSHPPIDRDRSVGHLRMLADSYREFGCALLLVTATLVDDEHRRAVLAATGAEETTLVALEADVQTLRDRILAREPAGWQGLPELLNASQRLAASIRDLSGIDLVFSTEGEQPAAVADRIAEAISPAER